MHITHVTWGYPSQVEGHDAVYFSNQVDSLKRTGYLELSVVAPITWVPRWLGRFSAWSIRLKIPSAYEYNGIQVYRPRHLRLCTPRNWCCDLILLEGVFLRQFRLLKPDLVHVHGANSLGLAALNAAKSLNIRTVLTVHGGDVYKTPFLSKRHLSIFKEAMRSSSRCLAVSSNLAVTASNLSGIQVMHAPIGIDMKRFSGGESKENARDQFGIPHEHKVILYLGNLFLEKGVQVVLDALDKLPPDVFGAFAGDGPMSPIVRQHPKARWLGPITYSSVPNVIRLADVLVLPSFSEGLGTVLVEAGAMEVPVIGTNVGGIPELLADDRGCLVPVKDSLALSQCITRVLGNPSEARERAVRLNRYVRANYDADVNSCKLLRMYQELLSL